MNCIVSLLPGDYDFVAFWASEIAKHLQALYSSFTLDDSCSYKSQVQILQIEWADFVKKNPVQDPDKYSESTMICLFNLIAKTRNFYISLDGKSIKWIGWIAPPFLRMVREILEMYEKMLRKKYLSSSELAIFWIKMFEIHLELALQFLSHDVKCWRKTLKNAYKRVNHMIDKKNSIAEYLGLFQTIYAVMTQVYGRSLIGQITTLAPPIYFDIFITEENRAIMLLNSINTKGDSTDCKLPLTYIPNPMAYPVHSKCPNSAVIQFVSPDAIPKPPVVPGPQFDIKPASCPCSKKT